MFSVRNLVEARFATPPLGLGTLTVRALVSTKNIEGVHVRDIGCLDFCDNVLALELPGSEQERVLDQALAKALENKADFACMVLKVKPRVHRSINPNLLGSRYRIGALEFVEVVDANACPRSPEDRPLRLDQQPQLSFSNPTRREAKERL